VKTNILLFYLSRGAIKSAPPTRIARRGMSARSLSLHAQATHGSDEAGWPRREREREKSGAESGHSAEVGGPRVAMSALGSFRRSTSGRYTAEAAVESKAGVLCRRGKCRRATTTRSMRGCCSWAMSSANSSSTTRPTRSATVSSCRARAASYGWSTRSATFTTRTDTVPTTTRRTGAASGAISTASAVPSP
jgi:hypothetical protein